MGADINLMRVAHKVTDHHCLDSWAAAMTPPLISSAPARCQEVN
jgi:hypothetical protein